MNRKTLTLTFVITFILIIALLILAFKFNQSINGNAIGDNLIKCSDSDGGLNYDVKGVVNYDGKNYTDICRPNYLMRNNYLKEWYCKKIGVYNREIPSSKIYFCADSCKNGACIKKSSKNYICTGKVYQGLCFANNETPNLNKTIYESENIKIWSNDYSLRVDKDQTINFIIYFQNKKNQPLTFEFGYEIPEDYIYIISSDIFSNYQSKNEQLQLDPLKTLSFNSQFKTKKENFLGFQYTLAVIIDKTIHESIVFPLVVEPNKDYISCSKFKFPQQFDDLYEGNTRWDYSTAKCCNNVFYPSFECCSNSDCNNGKCVDGLCINKMSQGLDGMTNPAIGNKKVLMILSSNEGNTDQNPCNNKVQDYQNLIEEVENYYDFLAIKYINENSKFINFNWNIIGNFNIQNIGLNGEVSGLEIVKGSTQFCNINPYFYDEIIVYNPNQNNWCGGNGACAGNPILVHSYEIFPSVITHELAHNFGCRDLYTMMGGGFQWSKDLMTSNEGENGSFNGLQVCRGEMGWFDFNNNGIIDVKEFKQPIQIKINYTGIHDEERPKGRYIIFENLSIFALNDNIWRPFLLDIRPSISIIRDGNEEYNCFGSETCTPVFTTDIILLRANYSYLNTTIGTVIEISDEIELPVADLTIND